MFVILWIKENKYYTYNKKNHWSENIEEAGQFSTLEKAYNYAKNGLKDRIDELDYVTFDNKKASVESEDITIPTYTQEEAEIAYEELRVAAEIFGEAMKKAPAIVKYYTKVRSEQDKLQEDLLHKFEFDSSGILVQLGVMLRACRLKRREAKDRLDYMKAICNANTKDVLGTHNDYNTRIKTRTYTPRINSELFN